MSVTIRVGQATRETVAVDSPEDINVAVSQAPGGGGGGGIPDGDKGDITVSGSGTVWTIDNSVVTTAKMGGDVTAAGKALLDDADASAQRTTLGLGTAATQSQAFLLDRANHTGTQLAATISNFAATVLATVLTGLSTGTNAAITAADTILSALGKIQAQINGHFGVGGTTHPAATTSVAGFMAAADKTKLDGIQAGATANQTDAYLLSRANHTGTQAFSTITQATNRLLGRTTAGSGTVEEISVGSGLTFTAGVLDTAGGGSGMDINGLTAETNINTRADYLPVYDASAAANRKFLIRDTQYPDASRYWGFYEEFLNGGSVLGGNMAAAQNGAGAGVTAVVSTTTELGLAQFSTGTTATGRAAVTGNSGGVRFGTDLWYFCTRYRTGGLSTATETYTLRFGFIDSVTAESTDGVFWRYTHGTNSGNWQLVARNNNNETGSIINTSTAPVTSGLQKLEITVNAAGTSVEGFIDGVSVGTITTNIPTASGRETGYGLFILKSVSVGSTASLIAVDNMQVVCTRTTPQT